MDVVGRGLISSTVARRRRSSQMKSTPTNPRRPGTDSTADRSGRSSTRRRRRQPSAAVLESAVTDDDVVARRCRAARPARRHRPGSWRSSAGRSDTAARSRRGISRAASGEALGVLHEERIDRAGTVVRLEDGRIGRIGGETLTRVDAPAGRSVDPAGRQPSGEGRLVARQRDGFGRTSRADRARRLLKPSRQVRPGCPWSRGR